MHARSFARVKSCFFSACTASSAMFDRHVSLSLPFLFYSVCLLLLPSFPLSLSLLLPFHSSVLPSRSLPISFFPARCRFLLERTIPPLLSFIRYYSSTMFIERVRICACAMAMANEIRAAHRCDNERRRSADVDGVVVAAVAAVTAVKRRFPSASSLTRSLACLFALRNSCVHARGRKERARASERAEWGRTSREK